MKNASARTRRVRHEKPDFMRVCGVFDATVNVPIRVLSQKKTDTPCPSKRKIFLKIFSNNAELTKKHTVFISIHIKHLVFLHFL